MHDIIRFLTLEGMGNGREMRVRVRGGDTSEKINNHGDTVAGNQREAGVFSTLGNMCIPLVVWVTFTTKLS